MRQFNVAAARTLVLTRSRGSRACTASVCVRLRPRHLSQKSRRRHTGACSRRCHVRPALCSSGGKRVAFDETTAQRAPAEEERTRQTQGRRPERRSRASLASALTRAPVVEPVAQWDQRQRGSVSRFGQRATVTHLDTSRANYCLPAAVRRPSSTYHLCRRARAEGWSTAAASVRVALIGARRPPPRLRRRAIRRESRTRRSRCQLRADDRRRAAATAS